MATPHPIRLAFIGTGHWARASHLPALAYIRTNLRDEFDLQLRGIYGIEEIEASALQQQYGFEKQYHSLRELVEDESVDAVAVIVSPGATREVVLRILETRKVPLLTEKPPGANYAEALDLADRVRSLHSVAFNRRYKPLNNVFREYVRAAGSIRSVDAMMARQNRTEANFILHTGIHLINYIEYLCGPIVAVQTRVKNLDTRTEHQCDIAFASQATGRIVFAPVSRYQYEGMTVKTDDQTLTIRCPLNDEPGEVEIEQGDASLCIPGEPEMPKVVREGFVDEYLELFDAIRTEAPIRSTFQNAANCMRIAEAIEKGQAIDPD